MKSPPPLRRLSLILLLVLASAHVVAAQTTAERPQPRLITVSGHADVRAVPDEVIFDVGVQSFNRDLRLAKSQTDERVRRLIELTRKYNIGPADVQTDYVRVEPRYRGGSDARTLLGYSVRKDLVFKLREVSQAEALLSEVLEADVTRVNRITFQTSQMRKYRDQARALAIRAAREKAVALTAEIGQTIGKAYSIEEEPEAVGPRPISGGVLSNTVTFDGNSSEVEGTLALGQITVSARVLVRFELQ